jgi:DNA gyrase subunit A
MSVIISRALPDARDGLKPSQRRILFAMDKLGVQPNRSHVKCAKIVGETMGNYHPHGDQAIYPTLVHMAQPWSMRETLVEGQGNFGSIDGDPPASMRYTEARLRWLGVVLMKDMDKDTVDFVPTYDEKAIEPTVFPASFPNLLVNGGVGIAVGMATNIPPHNLGETIDAVCAMIDDPKITPDKLLKIMPGPDFPTGGEIVGMTGIRSYFKTGRGSMRVRGRIGVEEGRQGKDSLIVTEVPYGVSPEELIRRIAALVEEKKIEGITDVRNESDEATRVVIELKRDAIPKVIIANLLKNTPLETSFSANMLALDNRRPRLLPVKDMLQCYIEHRREVIVRRTRYLLAKAEERAHILEGYLIALKHLDDIVRLIRRSKDRATAKSGLIANYKLSERQADAILELQLYRLTGLERDKIENEYKEIQATIKELKAILASEKRVLQIIKDELQEIKTKYATPRRTRIVPEEGEIDIEDLIAKEGCIITLSHRGYIKRTDIASIRAQKRGGKGVIGMTTKKSAGPEQDDDFVEHLFSATTHDFLMFFTNKGRVFVEKVYEIPEGTRAARGKSIANILSMQPSETIAAMICVSSFEGNSRLVMATASGVVKKTLLTEYANFRKGGMIAIKLDQANELIGVALTTGRDELVLVTSKGKSIRFVESQLRDMGRATMGVAGIRPQKGDKVVGLAVVDPEASLLVASRHGIGKRTPFKEYRKQSRGGSGIITMKTTPKTGEVVSALTVGNEDEIMAISNKGLMIRMAVKDIREAGRNTQGVRLVNLTKDDSLQAIAPVITVVDIDEEEV